LPEVIPTHRTIGRIDFEIYSNTAQETEQAEQENKWS